MSQTPPPAFLELQGIAKTFGRFTALGGVSLHVPRGELVTFLGPSGCGKTTLLRIIAGLETQDAGRILREGRDISRLPAIKRDYGIVFQSYALFPNLTIFDNVAYGLVNRRAGRAQMHSRVDELLRLVGLPDAGPKYPGQLSGGQQQRIALARALATAPGLLLLDEPLSALDAQERVRLRTEIRALQQRPVGDHDHGDARPGRGAVDGRPRRRHEPGSHRAGRLPAGHLSRARVGVRGRLRGQGERARSGCGRSAAGSGSAGSCSMRPRKPRHRTRHAGEALPAARGCRRERPCHDHANHAAAKVQKIEFLGAFCMVTVRLAEAQEQPVIVALSRHSLERMSIGEGAPLSVGFPPSACGSWPDRGDARVPPRLPQRPPRIVDGQRRIALALLLLAARRCRSSCSRRSSRSRPPERA
jgi:iron(III) transport system ATP-binding protein